MFCQNKFLLNVTIQLEASHFQLLKPQKCFNILTFYIKLFEA